MIDRTLYDIRVFCPFSTQNCENQAIFSISSHRKTQKSGLKNDLMQLLYHFTAKKSQAVSNINLRVSLNTVRTLSSETKLGSLLSVLYKPDKNKKL